MTKSKTPGAPVTRASRNKSVFSLTSADNIGAVFSPERGAFEAERAPGRRMAPLVRVALLRQLRATSADHRARRVVGADLDDEAPVGTGLDGGGLRNELSESRGVGDHLAVDDGHEAPGWILRFQARAEPLVNRA